VSRRGRTPRRGGGTIYTRGRHGTLWIQYYKAGRPVRESVAQTLGRPPADCTAKDAEKLLNQRLGQLATGQPLALRAERVTYDEARADLRAYYTSYKTRDLAEADGRLKHLDAFFSGRRLASIGEDAVTAYVASRQAARNAEDGVMVPGAAAGTINRELSTLSKLLRLAYKHDKLKRLPVIEKLTEAAPRAGFVTDAQFAAIRRHLPEELQVASSVAYVLGWRKREVLDLTRAQYNAADGSLRLPPGSTKNGEGRIGYLPLEVQGMVDQQVARVRGLERTLARVIPHLFPHLDQATPQHGRGRADLVGQRIRDPRKAWNSACRAAGLPGTLLHDLRRSAVRNFTAAGVPDVVAMAITGHRTRAVFDRYNIVSPVQLQEAARKLSAAASPVGAEVQRTPARPATSTEQAQAGGFGGGFGGAAGGAALLSH
jgi:integrase